MPLVDLAALERLTQGQMPAAKTPKAATRDGPNECRREDPPAGAPEPRPETGAVGKWTRALN